MKVLVTGASGFIGGEVVQCLLAQKNYEIVATGRSDYYHFFREKGVEYLQWEMSSRVNEIWCDVCIHCAGLADDRSTEQELKRNNVDATANLLKSVKGCKQFIFISSASVYNFSDGKIKSEADATLDSKLSLYGLSKLLAESLIKSSGIPSIYIIRPRAVYGNGDRVLMPRIMQMIKGNRMMVPGALHVMGSLTHIENLCEAIDKCMKQCEMGVYTYNIADQSPYMMKSVFTAIVKRKCKTYRIIHIPLIIVKWIIFINDFLGIKSNLSLQSLQYITQNAVLDLQSAQSSLGYIGEREFFDTLPKLNF